MTNPTDDARDQLLHAIDFNYAAGLGYTPEGLLAAYDASRTSVDRTVLRDRIAEAALHAVESALGDTLLPAAREEALAGIVAVLPAPVPTTDQAAEVERLRLQNERMRHELEVMYGGAFDSPDRARPADRAAVLTAAERQFLRLALDLAADRMADFSDEFDEDDEAALKRLRRLADDTQPAEPRPSRGDAFEQWLKARRDEWAPDDCQPWQILDQVLEEYRLHAATGTPLSEHVCEGQAVGDCECLEQPAAGARQDGENR